MQILKFSTLALSLLLVSCGLLIKKTGTVVIDEKPYELSLTETQHFNVGYLVTINGEDVGVLEQKDNTYTKMTFHPVETKYGVITAEAITDYALIDTDINMRLYLDGIYIGTVNLM